MFSLFVYQNVREETNRSLKRRMDSGNGAAAPVGLMTYDSTWGNFVPALVGSVCFPISYVRPIQGQTELIQGLRANFRPERVIKV